MKMVVQSVHRFKDKHLVSLGYAWGHEVHHRFCLGGQVEHKGLQCLQWFSPHSSDLTKQTRWRKSLAFGLLWLVSCTLHNVQHIKHHWCFSKCEPSGIVIWCNL